MAESLTFGHLPGWLLYIARQRDHSEPQSEWIIHQSLEVAGSVEALA